MLPSKPQPYIPSEGFGLDRCQFCGRHQCLRWRYLQGQLEVFCTLCYGVHRGTWAQKMFEWWKANGITPIWEP